MSHAIAPAPTTIQVTVGDSYAELVLAEADRDHSDFYAVRNADATEFVNNVWVIVPAGSTADVVESAFLRGDIYSQ